jgi:hypothetical protein
MKGIREAFFTSKTIEDNVTIEGKPMWIVPTAAYCYAVGRNVTNRFDLLAVQGEPKDTEP